MSTTGVHAFDSTVQITNEWLHDIMDRLGGLDRNAAYHQFRAVLHALRDRLSAAQASAFASQLPMLVRGIFYEGWHPQDKPLKIRHKSEFLEHVARELGPNGPGAESVTRAVLQVLSLHISTGEVQHLTHVMPGELRSLFPEESHTLWF
jgi:uncharacterized protein (DUF2267 family)